MTTLPVYDMSGTKVGDYEIDPQVLAPKISKQLLHDVVVMYLANQRQGSNKTKSRGEVAGSTKKLFKQKGTGNARMGAKRQPVRTGWWSCEFSSAEIVLLSTASQGCSGCNANGDCFQDLGWLGCGYGATENGVPKDKAFGFGF